MTLPRVHHRGGVAADRTAELVASSARVAARSRRAAMNRLSAAVLLSTIACAPRVETEEGGDSGEVGGDEPGTRPGPGAMYSACGSVSECVPLEFCVFPTREGGYCSAACGPDDDVSACAPAPGDGASVSCLDIGTPDGRTVCALDCSDGACPTGMTCEAIATPSGAARDICF